MKNDCFHVIKDTHKKGCYVDDLASYVTKSINDRTFFLISLPSNDVVLNNLSSCCNCSCIVKILNLNDRYINVSSYYLTIDCFTMHLESSFKEE